MNTRNVLKINQVRIFCKILKFNIKDIITRYSVIYFSVIIYVVIETQAEANFLLRIRNVVETQVVCRMFSYFLNFLAKRSRLFLCKLNSIETKRNWKMFCKVN